MNPALPNKRVPVFQLPNRNDESFRIIAIDQSYSGCSWHFHQELQLCHVLGGVGQRIVGDRICPIEEGKVVLLGSNLPHVWRYDPAHSGRTNAVVVHFDPSFLGAEFLEKPEMRDVRLLMARAGQGLQAKGETRALVAEKLILISRQTGFSKVLGLLEVLHDLAVSSELEAICSGGFQPVAAQLDIERLRLACDYVKDNLQNAIDRETVAKVTHMSPGGFSRFFKSHTGMTFQDYVADVRIGHACQLLADAMLGIGEIASRCGYSEFSTFNRAFKKFRQTTPSEYRDQINILRDPSTDM